MILAVMRIPPDPRGHGGSQRAWLLVEALRRLAPVHFVLVSRKRDLDAAATSLEPLRSLVESVTHIDIPEWEPLARERLPRWARKLHTGWFDALNMRSQEAPRLSDAALEAIARQLPVCSADVLFAGRIPSAVIADQLIATGRLQVARKIVDFDDVMSKFRRGQLDRETKGLQWQQLARIDAHRIEKAEARVALSWDAVSVCTDEDVELLKARYPSANLVKAPNVMTRQRLPLRSHEAPSRVLFVGNLSFSPNVHGLLAFLRLWPKVASRAPGVRFTVAGLNPLPEVAVACAQFGAELHPNVPDLEPLYAGSDVVVAPILFGGGTRIKILEAMAYGRPVVSTSMGAEGLDIVSGEHALIADGMDAFGDAVVRLVGDPGLRARLADAAHVLQQRRFGFTALADAVACMVDGPAA